MAQDRRVIAQVRERKDQTDNATAMLVYCENAMDVTVLQSSVCNSPSTLLLACKYDDHAPNTISVSLLSSS